jgi:hypothetical protein
MLFGEQATVIRVVPNDTTLGSSDCCFHRTGMAYRCVDKGVVTKLRLLLENKAVRLNVYAEKKNL